VATSNFSAPQYCLKLCPRCLTLWRYFKEIRRLDGSNRWY